MSLFLAPVYSSRWSNGVPSVLRIISPRRSRRTAERSSGVRFLRMARSRQRGAEVGVAADGRCSRRQASGAPVAEAQTVFDRQNVAFGVQAWPSIAVGSCGCRQTEPTQLVPVWQVAVHGREQYLFGRCESVAQVRY